jgi:DNA invertase Pin-like site-specific DNA recombinase
MNIVLLKGKSSSIDIKSQQQTIIKYAKHNSLSLDETEIENSDDGYVLEERKEFKGFLRSLNHHDHILIYDFHTLSSHTAELVKILECFLNRSITLHICSKNIYIDEKTSIFELLQLLSKFREECLYSNQKKSQGRPKGRMSKSKFDNDRNKIIDFLSQGISVNEISKILQVSRTSLKDYINSRGLKDLVRAKLSLLDEQKPEIVQKKDKKIKECSLIKE